MRRVGQGVYEGGFVMTFKNKAERLAYRQSLIDSYEAEDARKKALKKTWRENNKDLIKEYSKTYYADNRDAMLSKSKSWQEENKEYWADYQKSHYSNNKASVDAAGAKRRALKRKQIPVHLRDCPNEKQRLVKTYKLRNILSEATGVQHHVDHMWPLNDGGPHWSGNLQVITAYDNHSKHASVCEDTKATIIKSLYTFESDRAI